MAWPVRLQLSRRKGFDLQALSRATNGLPALRVTRPGPWGNPFVIAEVAAELGVAAQAAHDEAIVRCRRWLAGTLTLPGVEPPDPAELRAALGGKNLACWCRLEDRCHADLLLTLANPGSGKAAARKRRPRAP